MQMPQLKIPEPVVLPVGGDRELGREKKRERHLGTIISHFCDRKRGCLGESEAMFAGIVTKSFSFYPSSFLCLFY